MMSGTRPWSILDAARRQAGVTREQLWVDYIGLGGAEPPARVWDYLRGSYEVDRLQYDMLAQALNERYMDKGLDHPVPYFDELE